MCLCFDEEELNPFLISIKQVEVKETGAALADIYTITGCMMSLFVHIKLL